MDVTFEHRDRHRSGDGAAVGGRERVVAAQLVGEEAIDLARGQLDDFDKFRVQ